MGRTVLVRGLTGRERDEFEASVHGALAGEMVQDLANVRAKLVARCVVDEDGERLFTDADVAALGEKSGAAIDRVFTVASRLSGLRDEDVKELTAKFRRDEWRVFIFTLAARLGTTVAGLLGQVSSHELTEWSAFLQFEAEQGREEAAAVSTIPP